MIIKKLPKFILVKTVGKEFYEIQPYSKKAIQVFKESRGQEILTKCGKVIKTFLICAFGQDIRDICDGFISVSNTLFGYNSHFTEKHCFDRFKILEAQLNGWEIYGAYWTVNEKEEPYLELICKLNKETEKFEKYERK